MDLVHWFDQDSFVPTTPPLGGAMELKFVHKAPLEVTLAMEFYLPKCFSFRPKHMGYSPGISIKILSALETPHLKELRS